MRRLGGPEAHGSVTVRPLSDHSFVGVALKVESTRVPAIVTKKFTELFINECISCTASQKVAFRSHS